MDVRGIQKRLREFASERDWDRFHTPKNLAMALAVEAAELVEIFQWLTPEESAALSESSTDKQAVADELADIVNYALRLADILDIDVESATVQKVEKNAIKYPPMGSRTPRSV